MEILSEITVALSNVGMDSFSVKLKMYSAQAFGNYVAELSDGVDRLELVCDRGQVFLQVWDSGKNQFVDCTEVFPEMKKLYAYRLNNLGLNEWEIEDILRSYIICKESADYM